ncbi:MAG: DNA repair protein RecN, partial [Pseudomonadota bacterium]|nr:DNA repair protein RecN [Pseudomonadota bacterium]
MLRLLSVRNFVVVEHLELDLDAGFTVLTGETGAGKSILLDALSLLLGDRFELRQLKPGAERAELAASFEVTHVPAARQWLEEQGLAEGDSVLLRRTLDAQGKSRAWINGRPATLAQLDELGGCLVDLHGQHAHQSLLGSEPQRAMLDEFAGATELGQRVSQAWRAWRAASQRLELANASAATTQTERDLLEARLGELTALSITPDEWTRLATAQTRLAHAASLLESTAAAEDALTEGEDAIAGRVAALVSRLTACLAHDPALQPAIELLEPAQIQLEEASRELRLYRQKVDVDPAELARVEDRLTTIHDTARKHRVRPEALAQLQNDTEARLHELAAAADIQGLTRAMNESEAAYRVLAGELSQRRQAAALDLGRSVSAAMQELAMAGGRFEVALRPADPPQSRGLESVEFQVASHPKQPLGPLSRVASGGELSRIALAIQVVTSEIGNVPTLIFDEVDVGIGGAVAATVGRLMQILAAQRQVLCVTHLPQVAAFADAHYRVVKEG